jgi:signal peptidase I
MNRAIMIAIMTIVCFSGCSKNSPSKEELKTALMQELPGYLEMHNFSVKAMQNLGNEVDPKYFSRFQATVRITGDLYKKDLMKDDILFLRRTTDSGTQAEIFGKIQSQLFQGGWKHHVELDGNPIANLGLPLNQFPDKRVIVNDNDNDRGEVDGLIMRSGGMAPTLLPNEYLLVDKDYYKRHSVKRGDIVVFPYPGDQSKEFVQRVIGLPNDKIEIRDKVLFINNKPQKEVYVIHKDSNIIPRDSGWLESNRDNFGPVVVPQSSLFVMGDNRDHSFDSRMWGMKFINISSLKGKPLYIYKSNDRDRLGIEITQVSHP